MCMCVHEREREKRESACECVIILSICIRTGQGHFAVLRTFLCREWSSHSNLQAEAGCPQESLHGDFCQALQPVALLTMASHGITLLLCTYREATVNYHTHNTHTFIHAPLNVALILILLSSVLLC